MSHYKQAIKYSRVKNQQGRFLIDLLVVIGIIALMTTISIPYFRKYQPNLKLNGAARELTSDIRLAQQLTITEQVVHLVDFDMANDRYDILKIDVSTTTVKSVTFDDEVNFQQITGLTDNQVIFNSYGGVSESGQVILVNTNSQTATINIKPSGFVQLSQ